jgi:hypothetical protein
MTKKPQIDKFRDKARELGADESADRFDATLQKVASHKPNPKALDELAEMVGQKDPNANFGKSRKPD